MARKKDKPVTEQLEEVVSEEVTEIVQEQPAADLVALQVELEQLRTKSQEYLDGWQRERAEFANYKRRVEREREQVHQNATGTIVRRYLEVLDDLERALKNRPTEGEGAVWAEGIELIYRKLLAILETEGVQLMEAAGQSFDPNYHEAISHENHPDHESGQIIEVVKNGYLLGDRVLRPALVRVAQ